MNEQQQTETEGKAAVGLPRIVRRFDRVKCFFGLHEWNTVSVGFDGISHLNECAVCGQGKFLQFLGYASTVGKVSREEMQQWHREARQTNK